MFVIKRDKGSFLVKKDSKLSIKNTLILKTKKYRKGQIIIKALKTTKNGHICFNLEIMGALNYPSTDFLMSTQICFISQTTKFLFSVYLHHGFFF